jgi:hypothetical protein
MAGEKMSEELEAIEGLLDERGAVLQKLQEFIENYASALFWIEDYSNETEWAEPFKSQRVSAPAQALRAELFWIKEKFDVQRSRVQGETAELRLILNNSAWRGGVGLREFREGLVERARLIREESAEGDRAFEREAGVEEGWLVCGY